MLAAALSSAPVAVDARRQDAPPEATLGKAASIQVEAEWIWLEEGVSLFREPDATSGHLAVVESRSQMRVLERRGGWVRVRYGSFLAWFSESAAPPVADSASVTPEVRLLRARQALDRELTVVPMGPFTVYTDIAEPGILERFETIASKLPVAYRERYALAPAIEPTAGAVLLLSREADYREVSRRASLEVGPKSRGHVTPGLAVLYVGAHSEADVDATFVHELVHLLNRAAFVTVGPAWVEEGLANDLAFCEIDASGRLRLASVGGSTVIEKHPSYSFRGDRITEARVRRTGAAAALMNLQERWRSGRALPLAELTSPEWPLTAASEELEARYGASAFLVRFLLDGATDELAERFRGFLGSVSAGGPLEVTALEQHLGLSLADLDRRFGAWLEKQPLPRWRPPRGEPSQRE